MDIAATARAKAQAAVSEAQADVTRLTSELEAAQRQAEDRNAASQLLDSVANTPLVGSLTEGLRDKTGVDQAQDKADIDRLTAELSAAQDKLSLALKAQSAINAVTGADKD